MEMEKECPESWPSQILWPGLALGLGTNETGLVQAPPARDSNDCPKSSETTTGTARHTDSCYPGDVEDLSHQYRRRQSIPNVCLPVCKQPATLSSATNSLVLPTTLGTRVPHLLSPHLLNKKQSNWCTHWAIRHASHSSKLHLPRSENKLGCCEKPQGRTKQRSSWTKQHWGFWSNLHHPNRFQGGWIALSLGSTTSTSLEKLIHCISRLQSTPTTFQVHNRSWNFWTCLTKRLPPNPNAASAQSLCHSILQVQFSTTCQMKNVSQETNVQRNKIVLPTLWQVIGRFVKIYTVWPSAISTVFKCKQDLPPIAMRS